MLHLHRAERADRLVGALANILVVPPEDAFTRDVIAVPTRGIERWVTQQLSAVLGASGSFGDGVCANVAFPFPGRLVGDAVAAATGIARDEDPWLPERAVWPLLDVVAEAIAEPWLSGLAAHLDARARDTVGLGHGEGRRFATLRHLADLYDRYGVHRPAMVRAWAQGGNVDEAGAALPGDAAWQADLWRRLRDRVGLPSPAERQADACARLVDDPTVTDLPSRLSLFGLTRLPASYLEVLAALAGARDVHLFLLHPSPVLWEAVAAATRGRPASETPPLRTSDPSAGLAHHPLLSSWGRDAREMQLVLGGAGAHADTYLGPHLGSQLASDSGAGADGAAAGDRAATPPTVLALLQRDVRDDRPPPGPPLPGAEDERAILDPGDLSVQVHSCHGRSRQVEVLRDAVLHALADDPTLELRDVIVMCPDIDAFAPLIQATFGATSAARHPEDDGLWGVELVSSHPDLRVRLADRSLRQTNPVLSTMAELLDLAQGRMTASHVIDFASREPVRRRFGFDDDDLARIEEWVSNSGIRWGLDQAHRAPYQLDGVLAGTWKAGLDRVLLGVTMAEDDDRLVGGVLPLDDVDSGDIDLVGRFAELLERLGHAVAALSGARPVGAWADTLGVAADELTSTAERDEWQRIELRALLNDVVAEAAGSSTALVLADVQSLLSDRLRGRPTTANFRTGHLTMCTLVPMRSVPHRVVCLLGMDDGVFPRQTAPEGDDLIERSPRIGDRDARSEDRQLLLDALMAATDRLIVVYEGHDERTGAGRPPAVPVGELLDCVDATVHLWPGGRARDQVLRQHPLQPFDTRNFDAGHIVPAYPWSFDAITLAGAEASQGPRRPARAFLPEPLDPAPTDGPGSGPDDVVELDDLVAFVRHPVRAFLRQRVGIRLRDGADELRDALAIELDALERWQVAERLLDARLAGVDLAQCTAAEHARGSLPPGALGAKVLEGLLPDVEHLVRTADDLGWGGTRRSLEIRAELAGGCTLTGTVRDVVDGTLLAVSYSRLGARHRMIAWVQYLAAVATDPDRARRAMTIGRRQNGGAAVATIELTGEPADRQAAARAELELLVDLRRRGLREPLPLYCDTSAAYAFAIANGRNAVTAARGEWETGYVFPKEDQDVEHLFVLGGVLPFNELLEAAPRADEEGEGWPADETSRFGRHARRLWDPLLAREELSSR